MSGGWHEDDSLAMYIWAKQNNIKYNQPKKQEDWFDRMYKIFRHPFLSYRLRKGAGAFETLAIKQSDIAEKVWTKRNKEYQEVIKKCNGGFAFDETTSLGNNPDEIYDSYDSSR